MRIKFLRKLIIAASFAALLSVNLSAQTITPVDQDDEKPAGPVLHYYDKHGERLDTPVLFLAQLDTVVDATPKAVYPAFNGVSVGVDFFDAIMSLVGQKHSSYSISADVSILNWIFPTVEAGVGFAYNKPDGFNYTYKAHPSFFIKAGFNYNFLYKSNPDYQAFVGFRAAFSSFNYDITDVSLNSPYWQENASFSFPRQHASAFYGEALAGLKVKIVKSLSLGWTFRYHFKMKTMNPTESNPWFMPGYGTSSPISGTFSVFYTFGQKKKIPGEEVNTSE